MVYFHIEDEQDLRNAVKEVEKNETRMLTRKRARDHDISIRKLYINNQAFLNTLVSEERMYEWASVFPHVENFEILVSHETSEASALSFAKLVSLLPNLRTLRMWSPSWNLIKHCSDKWSELDYVDIRFSKNADQFETIRVLKFLPKASYVQLHFENLTAIAAITLDGYLRSCPLNKLNLWFGANVEFPIGFGFGLRDRESRNMAECTVNFMYRAPEYSFATFFIAIKDHDHDYVSFRDNNGRTSATKLFIALDHMSNTRMRCLCVKGIFGEPGAALLSTLVQRNPYLECLSVHGNNTISDDAEHRLMAVIAMVNQTREKKIQYVEKWIN